MDDESKQELKEIDEEGSDLDTEGVEENESLSSEDSTDDTDDSEDEEIDWKAEYDKEHARAENYKTALHQKRQLRKKPKEEIKVQEDDEVVEDEESEDDDDNKPLTRAEYNQREARKTVSSVIAGVVTDPNKRKLVELYYETRIRQTGTSDDAIRRDVQTALDLADARKLRKTAGEMARVINKDETPPLTGSRSDRGAVSRDHKFSPEQVIALTESAKRIGANPEVFIRNAWKNQQAR